MNRIFLFGHIIWRWFCPAKNEPSIIFYVISRCYHLERAGVKGNTERRRQNYKDMYDEDSKNIISIQFAREIELMGYKF